MRSSQFSKRGQNWSIEAMIAVTIFIFVVVISIIMINQIPNNNSRDLVQSSEELRVKLEEDLDLIKDYEVDEDKIEELVSANTSAADLGEKLGLPGNVCISFQTLDGAPITLKDSSIGIGLGNDTICGN